MYQHRNGNAASHTTYVRPDRMDVMRLAERIAADQGTSLSRFICDLVTAVLTGEAEVVYKRPRRGPAPERPRRTRGPRRAETPAQTAA